MVLSTLSFSVHATFRNQYHWYGFDGIPNASVELLKVFNYVFSLQY